MSNDKENEIEFHGHTVDKRNIKTLKAYILGFVFSAILTLASFALVAKHAIPDAYIYMCLAIFAVAQLAVQVVFFLRLNTSEEGRWNLMPFMFTIFVVFVVVLGSLWIMYSLNYNMVH
jgi:cytochrome o ubiquinol oxidase subunit IV